jgi:LytS/YehU family sensor histidine kinase
MLNKYLLMPNPFSKQIKEIAKLFFIGGGLLTIVFTLTSGSHSTTVFLKQMFLNGLSFVVFGYGNGFLAEWIDKYLPWTKNISLRLIVSVIATIVYTTIAWIFIVWLWAAVLYGEIYSLSKLLSILPSNKKALLITLLITFFVSALIHGRTFLVNWRQSLIESEQLKKEHIAAKYETLRNQVNPHFLFNSLNVLTTLVHKDADLAEQFIRQLSLNYRYVLDTREREVVPIEEEIKNLEAYIFLMKIRFGESLKAHINIKKVGVKKVGEVSNLADLGGTIAPLTLQMLVENALKHNVVSKSNPLSIEVFSEGDFIVVKNNVQLKNSVGESTGVGLENIRARYKFLSDKAVEVLQEKGCFIVKIPIIN